MSQLQLALAARDEGIARVAANNQEFLKVARATAKLIIHEQGSVTSDDLRERMDLEPTHPNAYGAVFRSKEFVTDGSWRTSKLVQGHGNQQRVWRLA